MTTSTATLAEAVRNWGWWSTPEWDAYSDAYGSPRGRPLNETSYVVDLSEDPWVNLPRGHRSRIRQQMATQHVRTTKNIEPFHRAHAASAGRETRSQETWNLMQDWLLTCKAVCATNGEGGWAYVICHPPGAYYASAAGKNCHYLQFKIICGLKDAGFDWYELGAAHNEGIGTFKRGLAGVSVEP